MPNLAQYHPQIVHFVIALLIVGVAMRVVSLTGRLRFTNLAALTLILIGTGAAVLAVKSGTEAHGPVERIPGTRPVVSEHEEHGEMARNVFLVVALIEIGAFVMARRASVSRYAGWAWALSAVVGLYGCWQLYETGEHGGELVYSYAGGPGLRTGNPEDVDRLLLAGLYNKAMADRRAGNAADAAELIDVMSRRFPASADVQILHAESLLRDKHLPAEGMEALNKALGATPTPALLSRTASLRADLLLAMGLKDSARAVLKAASDANPRNTRLKAKLDSIQ